MQPVCVSACLSLSLSLSLSAKILHVSAEALVKVLVARGQFPEDKGMPKKLSPQTSLEEKKSTSRWVGQEASTGCSVGALKVRGLPVSVKKTFLFVGAFAMQSLSRNCSSAPDCVL